MVDQKYIVLMHKDIDDEISAAERILLLDYISKNSEAETLYQQLILVNKSLSDVKEIDPPAGLKPTIIAAIDPQRYSQNIKKETYINIVRTIYYKQSKYLYLS